MMKKIGTIVILLVSVWGAAAQELPQPAGDMMYTEYKSERKMKYVKKVINASGRIMMFDKDNLVYTQEQPTEFVVIRTAKSVTYKRAGASPIQIDTGDESLSDNNDFRIMMIFGQSDKVREHFEISMTETDDYAHYVITPRRSSKIKQMRALAAGDKLSNLIIIYNDDSTLRYTFHNTVTGTMPPDYEKYFR